jgi:hypothetical protein
MTNVASYTIGSDVTCDNEKCGQLSRVIVEPIDRVLTHLVVEPKHGRNSGCLVPIGLVDSSADQAGPATAGATAEDGRQSIGEIRLTCTKAEFDALEAAEETKLAGGGDEEWRYEQDQIAAHHDGLGLRGGIGVGPGGLGNAPLTHAGSGFVTHDRVPPGEVQLRGGEHVQAVDGAIGRVHGLAADRVDHHVTHVLLDKGHLWGHKTVAIPIEAIADVDEGVRVNLTKAEVRDLPPIHLDDSLDEPGAEE